VVALLGVVVMAFGLRSLAISPNQPKVRRRNRLAARRDR
jgi:hypothetical protein